MHYISNTSIAICTFSEIKNLNCPNVRNLNEELYKNLPLAGTTLPTNFITLLCSQNVNLYYIFYNPFKPPSAHPEGFWQASLLACLLSSTAAQQT